MRTRVHRALAALRTHVAALRLWLMPGALSLKPALAVLIVFAAGAESVRRCAAGVDLDERSAPTAGGPRARPSSRIHGAHTASSRTASDNARHARAEAPRAEPSHRRARGPALRLRG